MPLYFIENQGQLDDEVFYYLQGADKTLYFTREGIVFSLLGDEVESWNISFGDEQPFQPKSQPTRRERYILKLNFIDANPHVEPLAQTPHETVISYFKGLQEDWHTVFPRLGS